MFFGFALLAAIYSRRNRQVEEPEVERLLKMQNSDAVEPKAAISASAEGIRPDQSSVTKSRIAPENFKSAVREMSEGKKAIGARQKPTFSR